MPRLHETLQLLFVGFASVAWIMASPSMKFQMIWPSFWQLKQNFLNHLVTVLRSTVPLLFTQQMFFVASVVLWPSLNLKSFIIIIMSRRLRGYPWPSLAISPYHSSPPAGLQGRYQIRLHSRFLLLEFYRKAQ